MDRREYFKLGVAGAVGAALSAQPAEANRLSRTGYFGRIRMNALRLHSATSLLS